MLKRQRQSSPPPFVSNSVPLVSSDTPSADEPVIVRDVKRRRTQPPVLDGMMRGWNSPSDEDGYFSEDGDAAPDDADEDWKYHGPPQSEEAPAGSTEYQSANNLLRELHVLNQHRIMFKSPTPSAQSTATYAPPSSRDDPSNRPLSFGHPRESHHNLQKYDEHAVIGMLGEDDESLVVQQRYNDTNRMLRELFLSRRRNSPPPS
ncbi:hypothetical protein BKA70DRAFT_339688 [Coprinopsis sp. MPI-PUGE-AT-0042]|nr:hypothetical protein BKA70DRAFT_339688 [Coprinopsis sp. MPI-PUGE-AT-0042]